MVHEFLPTSYDKRVFKQIPFLNVLLSNSKANKQQTNATIIFAFYSGFLKHQHRGQFQENKSQKTYLKANRFLVSLNYTLHVSVFSFFFFFLTNKPNPIPNSQRSRNSPVQQIWSLLGIPRFKPASEQLHDSEGASLPYRLVLCFLICNSKCFLKVLSFLKMYQSQYHKYCLARA